MTDGWKNMVDESQSSSNSSMPGGRKTRRQFLRATGVVAASAVATRFRDADGASPASGMSLDAQHANLKSPGQAASAKETEDTLFSPAAKWIWDGTDRWAYHHYLEARRTFRLDESELGRILSGRDAKLTITADAYYQAWLNGQTIGEGPAKAAQGRLSVDTWPVTNLLTAGDNELRVVALCMGVGSMTYCPGEAGLIFEMDLAGRKVASDATTEVRPEPARQKRTARRWIQPCLEDVDAAAPATRWLEATVVRKSVSLYARRVPLPTRAVLSPQRFVTAEVVRVPNVAITMRIRPYLTEGDQKRLHNTFNTPAYLVTDILSPVEQTLVFVPTLGNMTWYFQGRKLFEGKGWLRWPQTVPPVSIQLRQGTNRLLGLHNRTNHFEDVSLAGLVKEPVTFTNPFGKGAFQIVRVKSSADLLEGSSMQSIDWSSLKSGMTEMDPHDSMPFGNAFDLAFGSDPVKGGDASLTPLMKTATPDALELPATETGQAVRVVVDLGVLHMGWLAFDVEGNEGSTLIFAMLEGLDPGPPLRLHWPDGCNNALMYRLRNGSQSFESFLYYGVRYVCIQHSGDQPVRLRKLRVYTANCGSFQRGSMLCDDEMLNAIYRICAQSVISGVNDTFTDCPTYEQVNWNFDNRTATMGDAVTCANSAVTRNSIELFAEDPRYPGLVRSQYPSTWEAQIPLWSFHWIMWCRDHYWNTGDEDFVRHIMPQVTAGIEEGLAKIGSQGLLEWPQAWHFMEWGRGRDDGHAIMSGEQAGFVGALTAAADIGEVAGGEYAVRSSSWRTARDRLIGAINARLWDPKRRSYFDSLHEDGSPSPVASQTTNAAMAAYRVASADRAKELASRIAANDPQLLAYESPYGLFYVLEMLDRLGDVQTIFNLVRERYGTMVLAGDTCTWETFNEFDARVGGWPTRSRCHPFAAYAAKFMARYLMGIQMLEPGYQKFQVDPKPPQEISRCHGTVPTPKGLIRVGWEKRDGKIQLSVEVPASLKRV